VIAELQPVATAPKRIEARPRLSPFIKWPGGKSDELETIAAGAPPLVGRFIDPFVGGGSVLLATPAEVTAWANDACEDLIALYQAGAALDQPFCSAVNALGEGWDVLGGLCPLYAELESLFRVGDHLSEVGFLGGHISSLVDILASAGDRLADVFMARLERDLPTKFRRMRQVQATLAGPLADRDVVGNIEGAIRAAFYMAVRGRYNEARIAGRWDPSRSADFFFLREFGYAAMFRFNAKGEFNVPYGGMTYNRKSLLDKAERLFDIDMRDRLVATTWRSVDFELFLAEADVSADDFVFVDPPYDSDFSSYDNRPFGWEDQQRLARVLGALPAPVMVVIKDTPMIRRLYGSTRWRVTEAPKTYMWTIKSRNDRGATHLTITNY
jgi:DNA adenine methylase